MRRIQSSFRLLALGLLVGMAGCAGSAAKRNQDDGPWGHGASRQAVNPTREGWSEPKVVSAGEDPRLARYFPGLAGRNRVSTQPSPASSAKLAAPAAGQATQRLSGLGEVPVRAESTRGIPRRNEVREPDDDIPPPFLPTAMTLPSSRQLQPPWVDAPSDTETKTANLERPAPVQPVMPPLPDVNPATAINPEPSRAVELPTDAVFPDEPKARPHPRPELDVEELAPRIAANLPSEEVEPTAEAVAASPPLPPVDPLTAVPSTPVPTAMPTSVTRPLAATSTSERARSSTTLVRPQWVPFRRNSVIFNKPILTSREEPAPPWQFWNQPPAAAIPLPIPTPVPPTPSQSKGWFGTSWGTRSRALVFGSGS